MELKVEKKVSEPLLSRTRVQGFVGFEAQTPSRADLQKKLSESLKVPQDTVAVESIKTGFGEQKAVFIANVYSNAKDLDQLESVVTLRRHGLKEKKTKRAKEAKK